MSTTVRRITLALTKEDIRELDVLCKEYEENISQVYKRALILLYHNKFYTKKESRKNENSDNL